MKLPTLAREPADFAVDPMIEEARLRARRRRLGYLIATALVGGVLAVILVTRGGGPTTSGNLSGADTRLGTSATKLNPCPPGARGGAGGWHGRVAGIGCGRAGHLIQHRLIPGFQPPAGSTYEKIASLPSGSDQISGYQCHYASLNDGAGWRLRCSRQTSVVAFQLTP